MRNHNIDDERGCVHGITFRLGSFQWTLSGRNLQLLIDDVRKRENLCATSTGPGGRCWIERGREKSFLGECRGLSACRRTGRWLDKGGEYLSIGAHKVGEEDGQGFLYKKITERETRRKRGRKRERGRERQGGGRKGRGDVFEAEDDI